MNIRLVSRLLALVLVSGSIATVALAQDPLPSLTIAYFNGACPPGWDNLSLADAKGRTLLPTPRGGGAGGFIGVPLNSQQEPTHRHAKATGSITSAPKSFVLIDGCCTDLGRSGTYPMEGSTETAGGGPPYIQYNACLKLGAPSGGGTVPPGLMTFSLLPCSGIYSEYTAASGRYIVGLNPNGQPAATFGGPNLLPSEVRTHSHAMDGSMSFPAKEIAGAQGCCANNYATSGPVGFTGSTQVDTQSSPYDSAVQAPYYTAFFCEVR